jgi:hypothetical protein
VLGHFGVDEDEGVRAQGRAAIEAEVEVAR